MADGRSGGGPGGLAVVALLAVLAAGCGTVGADGSRGAGLGDDASGGAVGDTGGDPGTSEPGTFDMVTGPPDSAPAGSAVPLAFVLRDVDGAPVAGLHVRGVVDAGGGRVEPAVAVTDDEGRAELVWTLGRAPVANRLLVSVDESTGVTGDVLWVGPALSVRGTLAEPWAAEPFADVDGWLAGQGVPGSTEDLAFAPDGGLVIGVPGGLARVAPDGSLSAVPLSGEPLDHPLGVAYDRDGVAWVADNGRKALLRVSPEGAVTTALDEVDGAPLAGPNYVAIGPEDGAVYLSDPCLGAILRFEPATGAVTARLDVERATDGGPNGLAFAADGTLWFLTENTAVLCGQPEIPMDALLGHVFAVEVTPAGFGTPRRVAEALGHFGDGLAFDAEGNLYAIFDRLSGITLAESAVWVLASGAAAPERFLRATDRLFANLAFGTPAYGEGTLYIALLAAPPVTTAAMRGLMKAEVGIPGAL